MRIILVGFGVVGQNFSRMIIERSEELVEKFRFYPRIVAIADKGGAVINRRGVNIEYALKVKHQKGSVAYVDKFGVKDLDANRVIEEVDAEVVVEVTPTNIVNGEPGLTHIKTALKMGRHVVTTNKGPLALAFPALIELAKYNNLFLRFSGCVGGGTPILDFAKKCLLGDYITSFKGILNGTTNYILTRMATDKVSFKEALLEAQNAGYAEADPSLDIDGWDSACKLVILANWVLGTKAVLQDVKVKGIRGITLDDVEDALKQNCEIKLIASAENNKLEVKPQPISKTHPLCVGGTLNAVTFISKYAGEETIIGKGAGGIETASAVLRDLLTIKESIIKV